MRSEGTGLPLAVAPVLQLLVLCLALAPASQAGLIWESNTGNPLPSADFLPNAGDGLQAVNLGAQYGFPFAGTTYDSVIVATSGFVWLGGSNSSQCCVLGDPATTLTFFEQGSARIAPVWTDLRLDLGGTVDFNQIDGGGGARSVLTFSNVPTTDPANPSATVSFQVQLFTTGKIIFSYETFSSSSLGSNAAAVIGVTPAGRFPQGVDFTGIQPGSPVSTSSESLYDYLAATSSFDLSGDSFVLTPARDGWLVSAANVPELSNLPAAASAFFVFFVVGFLERRSGRLSPAPHH